MKSAIALALLGSAMAFPEDCPNVTVIHKHEPGAKTGWSDGCLGLDLIKDITTAAACKDQCHTNLNCSVWQLVKKGKDANVKQECWSGNAVHACLSRGTEAQANKFEHQLIAGERIRHGEIKVIANNTGTETLGLANYKEITGTKDEQMARCKLACETDVTCTVWQYGSKDGCWIEHTGHPKGETTKTSDWATKESMGGQFIEHTCPQYVAEKGLPWPWIITGIVLGLLALAAIIYALQKKPKVKKTRAVKIEPKAQPAPVYFIPQPTMLIPQSSVVMPTYQPQMQQAFIVR